MKKALGLIETIGLVSAIEAADAAVKAANIVLLGYENTKGGGKITVKVAGEVGAVNAAVAAGAAAAARIGSVYGCLVIPRPHEEIDALIRNLDRGRGLAEPSMAEPAPAAAVEEPAPVAETPEPAAEPEPQAETYVEAKPQPDEPEAVIPLLSEHTVEVVAEEPEAELEARPCAATTRSGEPCRLPAQPGSLYCFVHRKFAFES